MEKLKSKFMIGMMCLIVIILCIPVYSVQTINQFDQALSEDTIWVNSRRTVKVFINDRLSEQYGYEGSDSSWLLSSRHIYIYDSNYNLIEEVHQDWDSLSWTNNWKHIYAFDENNNLTEELHLTGNLDSWFNDVKWILTYDINNNLIERNAQFWDSDAWINYDRKSYTFDERNNMTQEIKQTWIDGFWINEGKDIFTYNDNNDMTGKKYYIWDFNTWSEYFTGTYTYDLDNNLIDEEELIYRSNVWRTHYKHTKVFDENNNLIEESVQDAMGSRKFTYTYNENNNLIEYILQKGYPGSYVNIHKLTYHYDAGSNMIEDIYHTWDSDSWIISGKGIHIYKNDLLIKNESYSWYEDNWVLNNYSETYKYDHNDSLIVSIKGLFPSRPGPPYLEKELYYYNGSGNLIDEITQYAEFTETAVDNKIPLSFQLYQNYPNPLNPTTTIEYEIPEAQNIKLQIFDITGRLVETLYNDYKEAGHWKLIWDASEQSSGIYIYRLTYGDKQVSRKMVVLK